jgi:hypothetical protein
MKWLSRAGEGLVAELSIGASVTADEKKKKVR